MMPILFLVLQLICYYGPGIDALYPCCTTQECTTASVHLKQTVNTDLEPCDDFFLYACGNFINRRKSKGKYDVTQVEEHEDMTLKKFVSLLVEDTRDYPVSIKNLQKFFKACMNRNHDQNNRNALLREIEILGGMPLLAENGTTKCGTEDLTALLSATHKLLGSVTENSALPFFRLEITESINNIEPPITIKISSTTFGSKEDPGSMSDFIIGQMNILKAGSRYQHQQSDERTKAMALDLAVFMGQINVIASMYDPDGDNINIKMEKLKELLSFINWDKYLNNLSNGNSLYFTNSTKVHIPISARSQSQSFKALNDLIEKTDCITKVNYIWFHTIHSLVKAFIFDMELYDGTLDQNEETNLDPVSNTCADIARRTMKQAAGALFVRNLDSANKTKQDVEKMTDEVKKALKEAIKKSYRKLSARNILLAKAEIIGRFIGFPDMALKDNSLDSYYISLSQEFSKGVNYFDMIKSANRWVLDETFKDLRDPSRNTWPHSPAGGEGPEYDSNKHKVFMGSADMEPPFFWKENVGILSTLNYGSMGFSLGHEMNHEFDTDTVNYDAAGVWNSTRLDKKSSDNYNAMASCFVKQYGSIQIKDKDRTQIDGFQTLAENIADNGGLKVAYKAYKKSNGNPKKQRLPEFQTFSDDKMFFLSMAQILCANFRIQDVLEFIETALHTPPEQRLNTMVQNSEEFSKAFKCSKGAPMNPKEKCKVWKKPK